MLPQRRQGHLGPGVPRARLTREPVAFAHERQVSWIDPVGDRRPLRCCQIQPRRPLDGPFGGDSAAQRRQRYRRARVVGVNDESERVSGSLSRASHHLAQHATPLRFPVVALAGFLARHDQCRGRVWAVRAQGARARERWPKRCLSDAHAVGQAALGDPCFELVLGRVPGELAYRSPARQAQAIRPGCGANERHQVVVGHRSEGVAQRARYHPFSLRHTPFVVVASVIDPLQCPLTLVPHEQGCSSILKLGTHVGTRCLPCPPPSTYGPRSPHLANPHAAPRPRSTRERGGRGAG